MKSQYEILIIGGGTTGIMTAHNCYKNSNLDIAIIRTANTHYYQPAWTLVESRGLRL